MALGKNYTKITALERYVANIINQGISIHTCIERPSLDELALVVNDEIFKE